MPLPSRFVLVAVFAVSLAAIGYEILLMRLLSIVQWHHFAYMIISLALLGYGASGTLIAMKHRALRSRFEMVFAISAFGFSIAMIVCFVIGQRLPFNALEVIWDPWQLVYLTLLYLVFFIPFLFAAVCIGLALTFLKDQIDRIYFFDLFGAGAGALATIVALFLLPPQGVLMLLALLPLGASALLVLSRVSKLRKGLVFIHGAIVLALFFVAPKSLFDLQISPFKGLSQTLEVVGTKTLAEFSSPLGYLSVVESASVPFREAPGLSFNTVSMVPEQLGIFTDGDSMSVVTRLEGDIAEHRYLGDMTAALPYQLLEAPKVLVLGAGGGADVMSALFHGAREVQAVELNPIMIRLLREDLGKYSGYLYDHDKVTLYTGEARGFVSGQGRRYDLIQVALLDSFSASGSGVQTLNESYLYTIEALREYLRHLEPGGILSITRWLRLPPRDSFKLFATATKSLRLEGIQNPGNQLAMIRNWNTTTLLVKNGVFTDRDVQSIRDFSRTRSFDIVYYPAMPPTEANRFNLLNQPYLHEGAIELLGERAEQFIERYKFNIAPASDDRPYFFHFFKWSALPEMLKLREYGGAGMIEWAYLILVATLAQAVVIGGLLILLPLRFAKRNWPRGTGLQMGAYFIAIGIAFMFVEMAFIQRFILFLHHPIYSVAVVLCGFLVFAGLGSRYSKSLRARLQHSRWSVLAWVVLVIASTSVLYLLFLPYVFSALAGLSDPAKIALSLAMIAPLAFFMGMPFPLGLSGLADEAGDFIPWAWGLNGYASVVSASLATLFAIEFGFSMVVLVAIGLYLCAAILFSLHSSKSNNRLAQEPFQN